MNRPDEKEKMQELTFDEVDEVSGGGAFTSVPRVPTNPIDEELQEKI